jgi:nuclear transcription factor Y gamma
MHVVHGELDAEVVTTTNVSAGDNNINWDEIDMASNSMLIEFYFLVICQNLRDVVNPYLLDDIMSDTSTDGRHS